MELKDIKSVYFVGAGGIGMSAIARYFIHKGLVVAGYDKTPSDLTHQLEKEGMLIHYEENIDEIPHACKDKNAQGPVTCTRKIQIKQQHKYRHHQHSKNCDFICGCHGKHLVKRNLFEIKLLQQKKPYLRTAFSLL